MTGSQFVSSRDRIEIFLNRQDDWLALFLFPLFQQLARPDFVLHEVDSFVFPPSDFSLAFLACLPLNGSSRSEH